MKLLKGGRIELEELLEKKVYAFCGIGNPDAYLKTLEKLALDVVGSRIYDDHHHYCDDDISDIYEEATYLGPDVILSTQKDWIKTALLASETEKILFGYLAIRLEIIVGEDKIMRLIEEALVSIGP